MKNNKLLKYSGISAIIAAICCFTPLLVVVFGAVSLSALVAYLDYILLPWLFICLLLVVIALWRGRKTKTND